MEEDDVRIAFGDDLAPWLPLCQVSRARMVTRTEVRRWGYDGDAVVFADPEPAPLALIERINVDSHADATVEFAEFDPRICDLLREAARKHPQPLRTLEESQFTIGDLTFWYGGAQRFAAEPACRTTTPNNRDPEHPTRAGLHKDRTVPRRLIRGGVRPKRLITCLGPGEHHAVLLLSGPRDADTDRNALRSYLAAGGEATCLHVALRPGRAWGGRVFDVYHAGSGLGVQRECSIVALFGHWAPGQLPPVML